MAAVKKPGRPSAGGKSVARLELVLKCDVAGTEEAVRQSIAAISVPEAAVEVIQSGVGQISQSDLLMAQTGSRLVIGFNVDVAPKLEAQIKTHGVEVRLYDTIYRLTEDIRRIAERLHARDPEEEITGTAGVIAVFKTRQKSQILGCEVREGVFSVGDDFRVITAMGPAHTGTITSLQVENRAVKSGKAGQQVGIMIPDWNKGQVGDLVECFRTVKPAGKPWRPRSGITRNLSG